MTVCPHDALKVGRTYLKADWQRCDACGACARVCARRAIVLRDGGTPRRTSGAVAQTSHPKPMPRKSTDTPRSLSATKMREERATRSVPVPKGGQRGGFQWTLLEAIAMLSVTFSAFTAKETAALLPAVSAMPSSLQVPVRVGMLALYYLVQVAVIVWLVRRRGGDPSAALGLRGPKVPFGHALTSAGLVVGGLVATRLVASLYAYVTRSLGLMPSATTDLTTMFGANASGLLLAIVMVVVVGPAVEEAVFRGALLEGLMARFGPWPAIVVQALLFAAFHRSVWMLFPTFALGIVLGWLAHQRDSLWPPIALHALYNAITVAAAFLVTGV
jgi:membrane protease YdiL (CAAX protease family)/ferredoxin